jgi:hypothetical protein
VPIERVTLVGNSGITHKFYEVDEEGGIATEAFKGKVGKYEIVGAMAIQSDTGYKIQISATDGFTQEALTLAKECGIALV